MNRLKEIFQSFLPWILFFVLAGKTQSQLDLAIIAAAISSIVLERQLLKKGFILSWGTLLFFIFMLIAVVYFKNVTISKHAWIFSNGALFLIAFISLVIRKPFTLQYAKEQVTKDKWTHPLFLKINYVLTSVWCAIFFIGLLLSFLRLYYPDLKGLSSEIISYFPSILGIGFTSWFPNWYKKKYISKSQ